MQQNAAWSTWSRNDFHRKYTVRGESDSWVHGCSKEVPPYYAQKNEYPLLGGTHHSGWLTCGPTKLTRMEGFVNLVNMNDSSSSDRTMSIQRPKCFFNLWSSCSSRPKQRRSCRMLLPPVAGYAAAEASPPPTIPTTGQALQRQQPHTAAKPVNPRTPLRAGFHCRFFPSSVSSPS